MLTEEEIREWNDDPASRSLDVRTKETKDYLMDAFWPGSQNQKSIFEALEAVSVNKLPLSTLFKISAEISAMIEKERSK